MCGIVAFYDPKINEKQAVIGKMMATIKHRGPNSDGYYTNDEVALGFRRLSIIDLRGELNLFIMKIKLEQLSLMVKFTTLNH